MTPTPDQLKAVINNLKAIEISSPKRDAICSFFHMNQEVLEWCLNFAEKALGEMSIETHKEIWRSQYFHVNNIKNHGVTPEVIEEMVSERVNDQDQKSQDQMTFKAMITQICKEVAE